jgi:hypothetical protein
MVERQLPFHKSAAITTQAQPERVKGLDIRLKLTYYALVAEVHRCSGWIVGIPDRGPCRATHSPCSAYMQNPNSNQLY